VNHVKKSQSADITRKGAMCENTERSMLDPEKKQWRIPFLKKFADKQLKQSPAVQQYKIIQAGTLVKSSMEMYVFMCVIVLTPWVCMSFFFSPE
jgi:hypothetical protein